jgi:6-phosphogluconolactonase
MNTVRNTSTPLVASFATLGLTVLALAACADAPAAPDGPSGSRASAAPNSPSLTLGDDGGDRPGAVYTLTNAAGANGVIAFHRAPDGSLTPLGTFATGGRGAGGAIDPLESQFAVVLDAGHEALFAVDAGSDQVSSFRVGAEGALTLVGTVASGGTRPNSLAVHGDLLYALNTGDNTLTGFHVAAGARLVALPQTARSLAPGAAGAAAIRFTPDGRFLVVAERTSNRLEVFAVREDGRLEEPVITPGNGAASFGFDITARGQPIVSETQGSLTSYALGADGALTVITGSIPTGGLAPCWVTITGDGRFAYTTNSASNTLSGFAVDAAGRLTELTPGAPTGDAGAGATPIDLDHVGTRFLYTLNARRGTIGTFAINGDGTLAARLDTRAGRPASGMQGLAAF